jgi:hypothetical protein
MYKEIYFQDYSLYAYFVNHVYSIVTSSHSYGQPVCFKGNVTTEMRFPVAASKGKVVPVLNN